MRHTHTYIKWGISIVIMLIVCIIAGCSPTRHVPEGEYLLDHVTIKTDKGWWIVSHNDNLT